MADVVSVKCDKFAAAAQHEDSAIHASLTGHADHSALDALDMLLDRVHAEGRRLAIKEAVIDLRQLEFLSSSCFKSLAAWVTSIQELGPDKQYKVKFMVNRSAQWQMHSVHSLSTNAVELVTVTEP